MVIKQIQKLKLNMQTKDYVETENNYFTTKKSCLDLLKIHYQKYIVLHREQEYTGCPRTRGSNLNCIFLAGNEGKKRLEKYLGCNSFLVMN
jgi:hypothetical protein